MVPLHNFIDDLYLYVVPSDNAVKDIDLPDFQGTPKNAFGQPVFGLPIILQVGN